MPEKSFCELEPERCCCCCSRWSPSALAGGQCYHTFILGHLAAELNKLERLTHGKFFPASSIFASKAEAATALVANIKQA